MSSAQRLAQTEQFCQQENIKLTPIRKTILAIIYSHEHYVTAYEILDTLCKQNPKTKSMTVYRVLNFLEEHHLIHKVPSKNAFVACDTLGALHQAQILLCENCKSTKEINQSGFEKAVEALGNAYQFSFSHAPIELRGICADCQGI